jgi:hypothetical protein
MHDPMNGTWHIEVVENETQFCKELSRQTYTHWITK